MAYIFFYVTHTVPALTNSTSSNITPWHTIYDINSYVSAPRCCNTCHRVHMLD